MSIARFYFGPLTDDALDAQIVPILSALGGQPVRVIAQDIWIGMDSPVFSQWRPAQLEDRTIPFLCLLPFERYLPPSWLQAKRNSMALLRSSYEIDSPPELESLFSRWIPLQTNADKCLNPVSESLSWLGFNRDFLPQQIAKPWQIMFLAAPEALKPLWQKNPHSLWTQADKSLQLQALIAQSQLLITQGDSTLTEIIFALAAGTHVLTDRLPLELQKQKLPHLHVYQTRDTQALEKTIAHILALENVQTASLDSLEYRQVFGKLIQTLLASSSSVQAPSTHALQAYQDLWLKKKSEQPHEQPASESACPDSSSPHDFKNLFRDRQRISATLDAAMHSFSTPPAGIWWEGPLEGTQSLALVNQALIQSLSTHAIAEIYTFPTEAVTQDFQLPGHLPSLVVSHRYPPRLSLPASARCRWVNIMPWEYGALPKDWLKLQQADQIWVPSEFVKQAFWRAGFAQEHVRVLPNGVDTEVFCPQGEKFQLTTKASFKFLFVGGLIERKGIDLLLTAFQQAFDAEDVCLVLKDWGSQSVYALEAYRHQLQGSRSSGPEIVYLGDHDLSANQLAALYRSCDVYVHPYRGEGFGMPILEAMACGLPVIVTDGGPATEFCPEAATWFVRALPEFDPTLAGGAEKLVSTPWWFQPDLDSLIQALRQAWQARERLQDKKAAARQAALNYDWQIIAHAYAQAIADVLSQDDKTQQNSYYHWPELQNPELFQPQPEIQQKRILALCFTQEEANLKTLLTSWINSISTTDDLTLTLLCLSADEDRLLDALSLQLEALQIEDCAPIELCPLPTLAPDAQLLQQALACIQLESEIDLDWIRAAHLSQCVAITSGQSPYVQTPSSLCLRKGDHEHLSWYLARLTSKKTKHQAALQNYLKQVSLQAAFTST